MKKRAKKFSLNRETVLALDDLQTVAGGARTVYPFPCPYSGEFTCTTCASFCTSNYC
jgi:hypothetical protein